MVFKLCEGIPPIGRKEATDLNRLNNDNGIEIQGHYGKDTWSFVLNYLKTNKLEIGHLNSIAANATQG